MDEKIKEHANRDIEGYRKAQADRLASVQDHSHDEALEIHKRGRETINATRQEYQDRLNELNRTENHNFIRKTFWT